VSFHHTVRERPLAVLLAGVVLGIGVTLFYGSTVAAHHARGAALPAWLQGRECQWTASAARHQSLATRMRICATRLRNDGPHGPRILTFG
jgi:hypothetical protein